MAFPNANFSDIAATTIEKRSGKLANNVIKNNALYARLEERGNVKPFSGGSRIIEEMTFAENPNAGWYSGYDPLPLSPADVISAASFDIKQAAAPVVMSGLEGLQNAGSEQMIDLLEGRLGTAEDTLINLLAGGAYSDGTGAGGKQIVGMNAAVPTSPTTGTYGDIDRSVWTFWRSYYAAPASGTLVAALNAAWANLVRGMERPDLILMDALSWAKFAGALQNIQRVTDARKASMGFPALDFMGSDVVLDGGIGGFCPANTTFLLNTKFLRLRPHSKRNMVPLSPGKRYAPAQDAEIQIIGWAGNITCSGAQFQGRLNTTNCT